MEELHELEINTKSVTGAPDSSRFGAMALEFEYGAARWWTSELYLNGQVTANQGALFTGFRWENRFKVLKGTHWINPVLYFEYEDLNGADKSLLEVVGNDTKQDLLIPNDIARQEKKRELENKLILASYFKGFTVAENFIYEKKFAPGPWEFGYAVGISRNLPHKTGLILGVEMYGGLGTTDSFGLNDTSHYLAPVVTWHSGGTAIRVSPGFGLNSNSVGFLFRAGVSYEVEGFGKALAKLFK